MNSGSLFYYFIFSFLLFSACRPDCETEEAGTLKLNFVFVANNQIIDNNTFSFTNAWDMQLTTLKMYFSNIKANNITNNRNEDILDVHLVDFNNISTLSINVELESGNYNNFSLGIGLDPQTNLIDPNTVVSNNPLHIFNGMHWAAWDTYIFMKLDGKIDTALSNDFNYPFTYHPGAEELYELKTFSSDFNIYPNLETEIDIIVNINNIFYPIFTNSTSIDIISEPSTHTFDGQGNVTQLAITFFENVTQSIDISY